MTTTHTEPLRSASASTPGAASTPDASRPRLRSVGPDTPPVHAAPMEALLRSLPTGAAWVAAPGQSVPAVPGRPAMVGYFVLVPADRAVEVERRLGPPTESASGAFGTTVAAVAAGEPGPPQEPPYEPVHGIRVDPERRTAHVEGRPLDLTYLEFELLAHLVSHPHRVHTRDHLVNVVWGYGHIGDGRTVDVHVARVRKKLGAPHRESIVTVRRVGYKFAPLAGH